MLAQIVLYYTMNYTNIFSRTLHQYLFLKVTGQDIAFSFTTSELFHSLYSSTTPFIILGSHLTSRWTHSSASSNVTLGFSLCLHSTAKRLPKDLAGVPQSSPRLLTRGSPATVTVPAQAPHLPPRLTPLSSQRPPCSHYS